MIVKDIMTSDVAFARSNLTLFGAACIMNDKNVGALPVQGRSDGLIGIITDRDIVCRGVAAGMDLSTTTVDKVMSKDVFFCSEDEDVEDAAHLMEDQQIRRLPVRNEENEIVGILALGDVSRATSHELTGEIMHEILKPDTRQHRQVAKG